MTKNIILEQNLNAPLTSFDKLPLVDMAKFISGEDIDTVAHAIGQACRDVGFLYLINHGVNKDVSEQMFAEMARFFNLPKEEKQKVHVSLSENHRGYFGLFDENTDPDKTADLKEGFDLGRDLPLDHPKVQTKTPLYGPNLWPENQTAFKEVSLAYQKEMEKLSFHLLNAFALSLGLQASYFDDKFDDPLSLLRFLRYPAQDGYIETETIGCGAHTDYGAFTILAQHGVSGLQVENVKGEWISVPALENGLVVNIGDQMARWTNGLFKATRHRVVNISGKERYSIPFFFEPNWDAEIKCLPTCQGPDNPPKFEPVMAGPYFLSRLNDTFNYMENDKK